MQNRVIPIFIAGSDYGGKGYVYDMLKRHPSVFVRNKEWYWAGYQPGLARKFPDLENPETRKQAIIHHLTLIHAENADRFPDSFGGTTSNFVTAQTDAIFQSLRPPFHHDTLFAKVMSTICQLCQKGFFVQLATGQHIERLARNLPEAKFIAIIRDPRNMLVSRKTRRQNVWTSEQFTEEQRPVKHKMTAYDPLWDSLSAKSDIRAMQRSLEALPQQMRLFHHPNLVADPENGALEICAFSGIPFDAVMLGVERRTSANWDPKKQAPQENTPRFLRMLHPCEIVLSQWVLNRELAWLGYNKVPTSFKHKLMAPFLLVRSIWDIWLRVYRRWSHRGTAYIFDMFKMYLRRFRSIWRA